MQQPHLKCGPGSSKFIEHATQFHKIKEMLGVSFNSIHLASLMAKFCLCLCGNEKQEFILQRSLGCFVLQVPDYMLTFKKSSKLSENSNPRRFMSQTTA